MDKVIRAVGRLESGIGIRRRAQLHLQGQEVDQQVHLGFDLAVSAHSPVVAANDGKVIWAAPLGIYGNCIVVDHGCGLQSIYGHLSEIA